MFLLYKFYVFVVQVGLRVFNIQPSWVQLLYSNILDIWLLQTATSPYDIPKNLSIMKLPHYTPVIKWAFFPALSLNIWL